MRLNRWVLTLLLVAGGLLLSFLPNQAPASALERWRVPVENPRLVRQFLQPSSDWSAGHRGVDYVVNDGDPVFAPHDGEISFVGKVVNRSVISIRHSNQLLTSVEPVCPSVAVDEVVSTGQPIGWVCFPENYPSHCGIDLCLHFSLRNEAGYLSPLVKLGGLSPSRLKPWGEPTCSRLSTAQC